MTEQPRRPQPPVRLSAALLALALVGAAYPGIAQARDFDSAAVAKALADGRSVELTDADLRGDLMLPRGVDAPLILRDSRLHGDLIGGHTSFARVVDLSGTEIRGRADFAGARFGASFDFEGEGSTVTGATSFRSAVFAESAHFGRAAFGGPADFSGSQFHGEARFAESDFAGAADFSLAGFGGGATFTSAKFGSSARFDDVAFGSVAGFTAARFDGPATFEDTRFAGRADFTTAVFDAASFEAPSADFGSASFDGEARFLQARFRVNGLFFSVTAAAGLDFQEASFNAEGFDVAEDKPVANFSTARLLGRVSFAGAQLGGFVNFDQAFVTELDLEEAFVNGRLQLPLGRNSGGRIGTLRLDLEDAERVEGPEEDGRPAQEAALVLVEATERADNNLETANDARATRLTLARERKGTIARTLDYWFNTGIWGFGVRPYYQLTWIVFFILVGTIVRFGWRRIQRPKPSDRLRGVFADMGDTIGALLRLNPPKEGAGPLLVAEYLVFKVLIVILVLNAANVWPVSRELIEGIF